MPALSSEQMRNRIQSLKSEAWGIHSQIERLVLEVPTGPIREFITEANIHCIAAVGCLNKADAATFEA